MDDSKVHIFWDNSNVFIGARDAAEKRGEGLRRSDVRIDFEVLFRLAAAGRTVAQAVAVGSIPPGMMDVWRRLEAAGVRVELQERGAYSGTEQAVDEALRLRMMHTIFEYEPSVCVLLTGDSDFFPEVDRMLKQKWGVEVLSFEGNMSKTLRQISTGYFGRGRFVTLDQYYESFVFLKGGAVLPERTCAALELADRPMV